MTSSQDAGSGSPYYGEPRATRLTISHGLRMLGIGRLFNKLTVSTALTLYCLSPDRGPRVPVLKVIASCL